MAIGMAFAAVPSPNVHAFPGESSVYPAVHFPHAQKGRCTDLARKLPVAERWRGVFGWRQRRFCRRICASKGEDMGKYSLILVSGFALIFAWMRTGLDEVDDLFFRGFVSHYERETARLTANSVASMSLARLREQRTWRAGYSGVSIGGGAGGGVVDDRATDTGLSVNWIRVTAWGRSGDAVDSTVVMVVVPTLPTGVRGGITANAIVTELGNLLVDGRDHDLDGNLVPGQGTLGVSTTETLDQMGASVVGGTSGGIDYAPANPADPCVVEEHATYVFPSTPDEVFGYAEGTLKAMAQSGADGGQHVTNPADLTFPLSGVTYVELGNTSAWQAIDFGVSTGVLIVHNAWGNAKVKDLNGGTFKGLIIADDIEKIHCTVIGGVIAMTPMPSGNCIGNGTGDVLYSREALLDGASVSAGGNGGMTVISWQE